MLLCADEDLIHCEYKLLAVDITQKGTVWECWTYPGVCWYCGHTSTVLQQPAVHKHNWNTLKEHSKTQITVVSRSLHYHNTCAAPTKWKTEWNCLQYNNVHMETVRGQTSFGISISLAGCKASILSYQKHYTWSTQLLFPTEVYLLGSPPPHTLVIWIAVL